MKKILLGAVLALSGFAVQASPEWVPGGRVAYIASTAGATPTAYVVTALEWSVESTPLENCEFFGHEAVAASYDPSAAGGPAILEVIKFAAANNIQIDLNVETDTCAIIDASTTVDYSFPL